jgi:hypothetical protein
VVRERLAHEPSVLDEHFLVPVSELLDERCRTLDVREQKSNGAVWKVGHGGDPTLGRVRQQRVIGLDAKGTAPEPPPTRDVKGSTTIVELLRMYPGGEAAALMSALTLPCAHCGGAFHEPLTMAAKRHHRDPRAVLEAFRALDAGGPSPDQIDAAGRRVT